jgi:hypothetical protein
MRVRVDQAGHQHLAVAINGLGCLIFSFEISLGANRNNVVAAHGNRTILVLGERLVHCQDKCVREKEVYFFWHGFSFTLVYRAT